MVTASDVPTTLGLVDHSLIEAEFRSQLSVARLFPGAALAVYRHGELALDLVGGYADTQSGELIRQIPSEEVLRVSRALGNQPNVILDLMA